MGALQKALTTVMVEKSSTEMALMEVPGRIRVHEEEGNLTLWIDQHSQQLIL